MKKSLIVLLVSLLVFTLFLNGCGDINTSSDDELKVLRVGATPLPHAELLEFIKPTLEEQGIKLQIVEFTDYVSPNVALDSKEIDANFFQHVQYMKSFSRERDIEMVSAGKVHIEPLGLYSKSISSIDELKDGAIITIPNDPSNEGRALILLDSEGIIELKADAGLEATENDIISNPKNLVFKPIDAAQLPRSLEDVDAAIINTNYALEAKLNPIKDSILIEGTDSPYANIVAIRPEDTNDEAIKVLIEALQSDEVKGFIEENYNGAIIPAF
ncbi:MetQ/NlpA family ABC transporter substrate-binding protein [Sporosalibacterium faouarense]|uniref:MetQ/NlpA family ABC transporter substrate-binding protein n=1 Tax=Sporosalibacterium faouarense TaxID=516123 RepID=UPI00141CF04F|nr:MetQ/NlpA family ABC transporter substrate-binding protein [Sporosalibacterium faouarense]MTI47835.1 ABC transporter substrate-binding protein [Bacillota bacterium]